MAKKLRITEGTLKALAQEARRAGHWVRIERWQYTSWDGCVAKKGVQVDANGYKRVHRGPRALREVAAFLVGMLETHGNVLSDFAQAVKAELTKDNIQYLAVALADGRVRGRSRDTFVDFAHAEALSSHLLFTDPAAHERVREDAWRLWGMDQRSPFEVMADLSAAELERLYAVRG